MSRSIRIAAIALATVDGLMDANYRRARRLGEIALAQHPDIILFPEAFAAGYCATNLQAYAEDETSAYRALLAELSALGRCMMAYGYLERRPEGIRNAVALFDSGALVGTHYKRSLWPDDRRPYRDERALMQPGDALEVFETRLGRLGILICYENMLDENWREVAGRADFILSPYNCQCDPSHNNIAYGRTYGLPSAWADRTGTVYAGEGFVPNPGTAGLVDARGEIIACSTPGVEEIIVGELPVS